MPSGTCDFDVLIFDSWSCTPLSEIVNLGIFWVVVQIWQIGISFMCEDTFELIA